MEMISRLLLTFLLNSLWEIPLAAALAALACRFLRKGPALHRHTVWVLALAFAILLPLASMRRAAPTDVLQFPPSLASSVGSRTAPVVPRTSFAPIAFSSAPSRTISVTETTSSVLLAAYLLFLLFRLARLAWASFQTVRVRLSGRSVAIPVRLHRVRRRCQRALGVDNVKVLFSPKLFGPVTAGGVIILPESLLEESSDDVLTTAIGHEMAHIARRDFTSNVVYELLLLPISFHPAAGLIRRAIERTREMACDEMVTHRLIDAGVYARSIVSIATAMTAPPRPGYTLGIFDGDNLEERILRLVERPATNLKRARLLLAGGISALVLCAIFASTLSFIARAQGAASDMLKWGQVAYNRGDYKAAAAAFDAAVRLDPQNLEGQVLLGNSLAKQIIPGTDQAPPLVAAARQQFLDVLARDSHNKQAIHGMMTLSIYTKQLAEAYDWTQKALQVDSTDAEAYYTAGFIDWSLTFPDYMKARQAAGMQPQDPGIIPDPVLRQNVRTEHMAHIEDGHRVLQTALQINPGYSDAMAYLNLLYRIEAGIANTAEESASLITTADDWVSRALKAKRSEVRNASKGGPTNPSAQPLAPPPPPPPPPPPGSAGAAGLANRFGGTVRDVAGSESTAGTSQPVWVEAYMQQSMLVKQIPPVYPAAARQAGISGNVRLSVVVGKDGTVQQIDVVSGVLPFVGPAMQAVRQWVYKPTIQNGTPVDVHTIVNVNFAPQ